MERSKMERGRDATAPAEIPARGWWDVLLRTRQQLREDHVGLVSAGVAFYAMLAVFPGMAALVSLYGLIADPGDVAAGLAGLEVLPPQARELLAEELSAITRRADAKLGLAAIGGVLGALWSANRGAGALVRAMNIAYDEQEERGFFRVTALSFVFTLGIVSVALVALALIVGIPPLLDSIGFGAWVEAVVATLPWMILLAIWSASLSLLYRYGPSRRPPRWRWVTPGAVIATLLWMVLSIGFSLYVASFDTYDKTYGSMGAVVVLLMWFYLSAYVTLLGAEWNSEMEHQTARDSTVGGEQPIGERGAFVADDVAQTP